MGWWRHTIQRWSRWPASGAYVWCFCVVDRAYGGLVDHQRTPTTNKRTRARHLVYADRYIKRPAQQQQQPQPAAQEGQAGGPTDAAAEVGTGGSDFVPYLEKHHRETKAHYVGKPPR